MRDFPLLFRFSLCTLFPLLLPLSAFLHIGWICLSCLLSFSIVLIFSPSYSHLRFPDLRSAISAMRFRSGVGICSFERYRTETKPIDAVTILTTLIIQQRDLAAGRHPHIPIYRAVILLTTLPKNEINLKGTYK